MTSSERSHRRPDLSVPDDDIVRRLSKLNDLYRLGLVIDSGATQLSRPNYISDDEALDWQDINENITRLHRTATGRLELKAALRAYRSWARTSMGQVKWQHKADTDPRLLGVPCSHIEQLKRFLQISEFSSPRYRKRKRNEISGAGTSASTASNRQERYHHTDPQEGQRPPSQLEKTQRSHRVPDLGKTHFDFGLQQCSTTGGGSSLDNPEHDETYAKPSRKAAVSSVSQSGPDGRSSAPLVTIEMMRSGSCFESAPLVQIPNASTTSSRQTSARTSFNEAYETPISSFGSTNAGQPASMAPPQAIVSPKRRRRNRTQALLSSTASDIDDSSGFASGVRASVNASRRNRADFPSSVSTMSQSTEALLLQLDAEPHGSHMSVVNRMSAAPSAKARSESTTSEPLHSSTALSNVSLPSRCHVSNDIFKDKRSPFKKLAWSPCGSCDFRAVWELTRVADKAKISASSLYRRMQAFSENYDELWRELIVQTRNPKLAVQKSNGAAWDAATADSTTVSLNAKLRISYDPQGLDAEVSLAPLQVDKSYRFARKFGADRFCFLEMPSLRNEYVEKFFQWLIHKRHCFVGRYWSPVYARPSKHSHDGFAFQVILFAVEGYDSPSHEVPIRNVQPGVRSRITELQLLDWLLSLSLHSNVNALKLFARLQLGFTKTTPSIVFKFRQIARTRDARSCCPAPRNLVQDSQQSFDHKHDGHVMNDGCGRISFEAAQAIRRQLNLFELPSAFQGRIAGAKGVWLVDFSSEKHNGDDTWIEITDSQHKFEALALRDETEEHHLTFEVHSHSHAVSSHHLNYQLIPILEAGGVSPATIIKLCESDQERGLEKFQRAMTHGGIQLLDWVSSTMAVSNERARACGIKMTGGFPDSMAERLVMLVATGHAPDKDHIVAQISLKLLMRHFKHLDDKPVIKMPKSAYVLMVPDPLGVLGPGEISLYFSQPIEDEVNGTPRHALDKVDAVLARFPAYLASDAQKCRAVLRPELAHYKDVVLFSMKGGRSLADYLSGGDFDGDKAWVCWEESLVSEFRSSPLVDSPSPEAYGIKVDRRTTMEVESGGRRAFLENGLRFNMRHVMLGQCANWFMAYIYHHQNGSIWHPNAVKVAQLQAYLVDTAKNGYTFTNDDWMKYLRENNLPNGLEKPAWRVEAPNQVNYGITMDRLRFCVLPKFRNAIWARYDKAYEALPKYDRALSTPYHADESDAQISGKQSEFDELTRYLKAEFEKLAEDYSKATAKPPETPSWIRKPTVPEEQQNGKYCREMNKLRVQFLAIEPPVNCGFPQASAWRKEARSMAGTEEEWTSSQTSSKVGQPCQSNLTSSFGSWTRFKASLLNRHYTSKRQDFRYIVAGKELCEIKALVTGHPTGIFAVKDGIFAALKPDKRFVQRVLPSTIALDEDNDDLGGQEGFEVMPSPEA